MKSSFVTKALYLYGSGNGAPGHPYQSWLHEFFPDAIRAAVSPSVDLSITQDLSVLSKLDRKNLDVIVNASMFMEPTQTQLDKFFDFVAAGGGFVALHAGLLSFLNDPRYEQMLGARFIGHSPIKAFPVDPRDAWYGLDEHAPRHPITRGMGTFGVVDELYVEQFHTDDLTVLVRSELLPVMWVRSFGKGRVVCLSLGHDEAAISTTGFSRLLTNGVHWASGKDHW